MNIDRRSVSFGALALAACGHTETPSDGQRAVTGNGIAGDGRLLSIRGRDLYVETVGHESAPALIYLHGGPGAGSYDFSLTQGALLSRRLRLIMLDQRGVLRSQPLADGDSCTLRDLIEDLEALREALGLRTWSLVGHSFGGYLGLSYTLTYPNSVDRLIFENATIDIDSSARELLRAAAALYLEMGESAKAQECTDAAAALTPPRETWARFGELVNNMPRRDELYFHGDTQVFGRLVAASGLPGEFWSRGAVHQRKLYEDGALFESLKPRLPELQRPSLMICSAFDHVTAPDQVSAFAVNSTRTVSRFPVSGHFAHIEEPEHFAQVVSDFVAS